MLYSDILFFFILTFKFNQNKMNTQLIERFIDDVRENEVLYDKFNQNYTKNGLKNKRWKDIGLNYDMTGRKKLNN